MSHRKKDINNRQVNNRRQFLGTLVGLAGSAVIVGTLSQKNGPIELPLHQADFYKSHNLAG